MTATNTTAPTALTLGQKEIVRGRSLTQYDTETGWHFCVDCLSDLPRDQYLWFDHVCTDTPVCLDGAEEPAPVVHKTRTVQFGAEALTGGTDRHGRPEIIHSSVSKAFCTCGWRSGWCDDRPQARGEARYHREHPTTDVTP